MRTTLQLQKGDRILWPWHDGRGNGVRTRHDSGRVVDVLYDPSRDGVVATVVCTRDRFLAGIDAVHNIEKEEDNG